MEVHIQDVVLLKLELDILVHTVQDRMNDLWRKMSKSGMKDGQVQLPVSLPTLDGDEEVALVDNGKIAIDQMTETGRKQVAEEVEVAFVDEVVVVQKTM